MSTPIPDDTRKITEDSENYQAMKSEEAQAGEYTTLSVKKQGSYISLINLAKPLTFNRSVLEGSAVNQQHVPPLPPKRSRDTKNQKQPSKLVKGKESPGMKGSPTKQQAVTRNQRSSQSKTVTHKNSHASPVANQNTKKDGDSKKPRLASNNLGGRKLKQQPPPLPKNFEQSPLYD